MLTPNGGVFGRNPKFNNVTVENNLTLTNGNFIVGTSGKGIDFGITTSGTGTMTSELLSDYEEGTFTPTYQNGITSPTYAEQNGWYTKIGRVVYFQIRLDLTAGTAAAGQIQIGGLPFTSSSNNTQNGGGFVTYSGGWVASNTDALPTLYVAPNSTKIDFYRNNAGIFAGTDATGVLGYITFQGFYIT